MHQEKLLMHDVLHIIQCIKSFKRMKNILSFCLLLGVLCAGRGAKAQNSAQDPDKTAAKAGHKRYIRQSGENNYVKISQAAGEGEKSTSIMIDGAENIIEIESGTGSPGQNSLSVQQAGRNNKATIVQSGGSGNSVRVRQNSPQKKD